MRLGRSRFNYLFDANSDGLLDVFGAHDRRVSNQIRPGVLLINQGNRKWKRDEGMMEYSKTMMVTDADGDGFAEEFLINRSFCYPQRAGPKVDRKWPELGPYSSDVKEFCQSRPVGTNAIYSFNKTSNSMEEISKSYKNFWAGKKYTNPCCQNKAFAGTNDCNAISMISGDFDNDQIADHVLLYSSKLVFFFSSDRPSGFLPDSSEYIGLEIKIPAYCQTARSIQIVDFDNDGKEEILVSCQNVGVFFLYTKGLSKRSWTLQNDCNGKGNLGDINNRYLALPSTPEMNDFCNEFSPEKRYWKLADRLCDEYKQGGRKKAQFQGLVIADINNDGFHDIISIHSFGHLRFFFNKPSTNASKNGFICFRLVGDLNGSHNQYGIGATVILHTLDTNTNEVVKQFREVSSFLHDTDIDGSKDDRIIFGLGKNLIPELVEVKWSKGRTQMLGLHGWAKSKTLDPIEIMNVQDTVINLKSQHFGLSDLCLGVNRVDENAKMISCEETSTSWEMDRKGRIWSRRNPQFCLAPLSIPLSIDTPLGLVYQCEESWFFSSSGILRYGGTQFILDFDPEDIDKSARLLPLADKRKTKWVLEKSASMDLEI